MSTYLSFKKVPPQLVVKIIEFYEYYDSVFQRAGEFRQLPFDLAMQLNIHMYKDLLRKCAIFARLSTPAVLQLLSEMRMSVAMPGHIVIQEGKVNSNLFFIHRGVVKVFKHFNQENQQLLVTLTDNDFFGERSVLVAWKRGESSDMATCASTAATHS